MKNPFAGYGKIMTGKNYIRRLENEKELINRTLCNEDNYGSVSVVGMQRMGKSSLVYNVYYIEKEKLYQKNIIVIKISMNEYSRAENFFKAIAREVYEEVELNNDLDDRIERHYNNIKNSTLEDGCIKYIQNMFKYIYKNGKRILCIIDEFDNSRKIFTNYTEGFNILRELAYQPDINVTFIFVSRRMITELEMNFEISTLANILGSPIYVKPYTEKELELYYKRLEENNIKFSDEEKTNFLEITGGEPYWCDLLMYHYFNSISSGDRNSISEILEKNVTVLYSEFERILSLLEEQSLLSPLYQVIFGPAFDCTKSHIQKLCDYGIIYFSDGKVKMFSTKLYEYLQIKEKESNFYPLWNKTEKNFRYILKIKLKEKYGDEWEKILENQYKKLNTQLALYIKNAISLKEKVFKQKDLYIERADYSILEGLTTAGIFELCKKEYQLFEKIFKMNKMEFTEVSEKIIRARNPYQHNNDEFIDPSFKKIVKIKCEIFNKNIENYFSINYGNT